MNESKHEQIVDYPRAGLFRRLAALLYDMFLVAAIWMLLGFVLQLLVGADNNQLIDGQVITNPRFDNLLFILMVLSCFSFYCWFWMRGGQTLGMVAWRIKVEAKDGGNITLQQALIRFLIAWPAFFFFGLGYLWIYLDRSGDATHDKSSRTKVIRLPKSARPY